MSTDNRNDRNSNNNNIRRTVNRNTEQRSSYGYSETRRKSSNKIVRKVENPRFYERENPEKNMRRVGRSSSEFDRETSYTSTREERPVQRNHTYDSADRYVTKSDDSIPEFKGFRHNHSRNIEDNNSSYVARRNRVSEHENEKQHLYNTETIKNTAERRPTKNLYTENDVDEDDEVYSFDTDSKEKKTIGRVGLSERIAQKREDKKRRADIIARSEDRSHRRRAVAKKKEKKILSVQLIKAAVCILIIFIVLLVTLSKCNYQDPYSTAYVTYGNIEFITAAKVSFIREETVYNAPVSGVLVAAVNEGEKVSAKTVVAYVTTAEHTELVAQLQDVENKIKTVQKLGSSSIGVVSNDVVAIDAEIEKLSKELAVLVSNGTLDKYSEIENEISALFMKRNEIVTNTQSESSYLSSLIRERDLIKDKMSVYAHPVTSEVAGTVSFNIDGNESTFSGYCKMISENQNSDIVNTSIVAAGSNSQNLVGAEVGAGTSVVKIITSSDYYIAAVAEGHVGVQSGKPLSVKSKDRSFNTEIEPISVSNSGGKTLIVGKTSTSLVSSLGARTIDADVITGQYEGMKVPRSCLTEFDATGTTARITLVRSNYVVYAYVTVLAQDAEYAIISDETTFSSTVIKDKDGNIIEVDKTKGVSVNDIYILKPENVKEGDLIS